eukprot:11271377-Karenia_brevis.AAC.1
MQLGFSRSHAEKLEKEINDGAVLADLQVHPHVIELLSSMHTQSWFKVDGTPDVLVVNRGGRQGCRFGGVIFNLSYAKALKRFYAKVAAEKIPARFNHSPGEAPTNSVGTTAAQTDCIVFDVTFVDDEALVVTATLPKTMLSKLHTAVCLLIDAFEHYGMTVNWKPGKTEAI